MNRNSIIVAMLLVFVRKYYSCSLIITQHRAAPTLKKKKRFPAMRTPKERNINIHVSFLQLSVVLNSFDWSSSCLTFFKMPHAKVVKRTNFIDQEESKSEITTFIFTVCEDSRLKAPSNRTDLRGLEHLAPFLRGQDCATPTYCQHICIKIKIS